MINFKLFGQEGFSIKFDQDKLIVFDGPNGFGKTTVFDAIELALTGNISRLHPVETSYYPKDIVVAHNDSKDVEIKLQLYNLLDGNITQIIRKLKNPVPPRQTKIKDFPHLWDLYIVDLEGNTAKISEDEFRDRIELKNIDRDFNLFHYIQQEETAAFLKSKDEKARAKAISELFGDTKQAESELEKFDAVSRIISEQIRKLDEQKESYKTNYALSDNITVIDGEKPEHEYLFPWFGNSERHPDWDKEIIQGLNAGQRESIIKDLLDIKALVAYRDEFLNERDLLRVTGNRNLLFSFLQYGSYIDGYESLKNNYHEKDSMVKVLSKLNINELESIESLEIIPLVLSKISYDKTEQFYDDLKNANNAILKNNGTNRLYTQLIQYRDQTIKKFEEITPFAIRCPMCGSYYSDTQLLLKAIEDQGNYLKSLLDEDGQRVFSLKNTFIEEHLKPIALKIEQYIININAPEEQLLDDMRNALHYRDSFLSLTNWLDGKGIDYRDLCFEFQKSPIESDEVEKRYQKLVDRINETLPRLCEDYLQLKSRVSPEFLYLTYFNSEEEYLTSTSLFSIESKITYIQYLYFSSISDALNKVELINRQKTILENKLKRVKELKDKLLKEIRTYRKKLITEIEIPLYIYSGKIIQTHQAGCGVFIKDPVTSDEMKNVKFVTNWNSDHDALNTMSSGQIAAVVISLTLALNRVYSNRLKTFLIDDPVQTMDDINMVSLVELLRNNFNDRQIILSTHEEDVSRYFLYKFLKHGHNVTKVNLLKREAYPLKSKVSNDKEIRNNENDGINYE